MSSTIETTNNIILSKIKNLNDIYNIIIKCKYDITDKFILELNEISNDYEMGSIKILSDYFLLCQNYQNASLKEISKEVFTDKKNMYFKNYQIFIKKENFIGKIDRIYTNFKNIINSMITSNFININKYNDDIKNLISKYENSTIVKYVSLIQNKCGVCKKEMKIVSNTSEMICVTCGITENLYGTVFEDEQFYYQEGQRSKHGSYDPSKHCRFWIERIQARESKEIPDKIINDIKNCIKNNNIKNIEEITCKQIRKYLSQTRHSIYNEHIPLIRKIITGESPPQLTDNELQLLTIYFDKVIRIYDEIKPIDKTNVPYHPYLIYKIIEHILLNQNLNDSHQRSNLGYYNIKNKKRINDILSCIHLQSRETLIENDNTWKQICKYITEIKYKPTDRNNQHDDI